MNHHASSPRALDANVGTSHGGCYLPRLGSSRGFCAFSPLSGSRCWNRIAGAGLGLSSLNLSSASVTPPSITETAESVSPGTASVQFDRFHLPPGGKLVRVGFQRCPRCVAVGEGVHGAAESALCSAGVAGERAISSPLAQNGAQSAAALTTFPSLGHQAVFL